MDESGAAPDHLGAAVPDIGGGSVHPGRGHRRQGRGVVLRLALHGQRIRVARLVGAPGALPRAPPAAVRRRLRAAGTAADGPWGSDLWRCHRGCMAGADRGPTAVPRDGHLLRGHEFGFATSGHRALTEPYVSMRARSRSAAESTMNSLRGATSLPINNSNTLSAIAASSSRIRRSTRRPGSMVVSAS